MEHQCTSDCNKTKDCPLCEHGIKEGDICRVCDTTSGCMGCSKGFLEDEMRVIDNAYYCVGCAERDPRDSASANLADIEQDNFNS